MPQLWDVFNLRLENWHLNKKGQLYQVEDPVKIVIPIKDIDDKLSNIRLYQMDANQYKIICFGKITSKSVLFPERLLYKDTHILLYEDKSSTICFFLDQFLNMSVIIAHTCQKYALFAVQTSTGKTKLIRLARWPVFMGIDESGDVPEDHGQDLTDFSGHPHDKTAAEMQNLIDNAASFCVFDSSRRALSIISEAGAPSPPVDGFPTNNIYPEPVKAMVKAKCVPLTGFSLKYQGLVKAVKVVKAFSTYRTCARARAYVSIPFFLINFFYYYIKCLDHLDQASIDAVFCLDHLSDHD